MPKKAKKSNCCATSQKKTSRASPRFASSGFPSSTPSKPTKKSPKPTRNWKQTKHHLEHLTDYAIAYFENLLSKHGKGRERRTEIAAFDTIQATAVVANNAKLYVNRAEGFIGMGLKKDDFVQDCSDIDDIIVFRRDGVMKVVRIGEKIFVGKDIARGRVEEKRRAHHLQHGLFRCQNGQNLCQTFQRDGHHPRQRLPTRLRCQRL
jgi:hypothetical protein